HPPRRPRVPASARLPSQLDRARLLPRDRHRHGPSPPIGYTADQRPRAAHGATRPTVRSQGPWYEAIRAWRAEPRTTRGGQPWYSALAILTALTLRAVFRLAYRQVEGLIGSIVGLLGLALCVPDHTTLSRRAATLELPQPR